MKNPEKKESKKIFEKTVYRFFGIPFASKTRVIDPDEFYSEMSSRFGREMTERVLKAQQAGR